MKYANVYELLSGKPIETVEVKEDAELTNVMQYLNQKYNSDDAVIRVETTASNSIMDPLNVIVGARFQLEARIAKIVRSVLKEGVLQPPPRMTKQIQDWARLLYYGHVWAIAEELLAAARVSPEDKIKAVNDAVAKFVMQAEEALTSGQPDVKIGANFIIGKNEYSLEFTSGIGLRKEVFYGIREYQGMRLINVPKSSSDPAKIRSMLGALQDFYSRLAQNATIKIPIEKLDHQIVEFTHIIEECKKYAAKPKYYKSVAKANFKCDISDWKYIQGNAEVADRAQTEMENMSLPATLVFGDNRGGAVYKYKFYLADNSFVNGSSRIEINVHIPLHDFNLSSVREGFEVIKSSIYHEMQHYSQTELGLSVGKPRSFGNVDTRISDTNMNVFVKKGRGRSYANDEYFLNDREFQTWIANSVSEFERVYPKYLKPGVTARDIFGTYVSIDPKTVLSKDHISPSEFFSALKRNNTEKWKRAVKTLWVELKKNGIL